MNPIRDAYINALLADASYVDVREGATVELGKRLTEAQAAFVAANFQVTTQEVSSTGGFDAVVWKGKPGTEFAGNVYVSIRGTQEVNDFLDDADLEFAGLPYRQIVSMVNWWLRATTPSGQLAAQITTDLVNFLSGPSVQGTGVLSDITSIESVNAHSLGGYLATAFTRLFGRQWNVQSVSTFNSAGFNRSRADVQIETAFSQITQLIGGNLGLGDFAAVARLQKNYFAENGANLTTNDWNPTGFKQYGTRVPLFQEDGVKFVPPDWGMSNHFMYKQTDLLALGAMLEKLDDTMSFAKLNALIKVGSNIMDASLEGVLDGLRKALAGKGIEKLPAGDESDSAPSRVTYHATLSSLQVNPIFTDLVGQLVIKVSSPDLRAAARNDFGALIALEDLAPIAISGRSAEADMKLAKLWGAGRAEDYAGWLADKTSANPEHYTDQWIADRALMLGKVLERNASDAQGNLPGTQSIRYFDKASNTEVLVGSSVQRVEVCFGGPGADTLNGQGYADRLYGGEGIDTLDGRGGNDYLEGNAGVDSYSFAGSFGNDTVVDTDGEIRIDGDLITGGRKVIDNVWESADQRYVFTQMGGNLIVKRTTTAGFDNPGGSITIRNWSSGQLGISLDGAIAPVPAISALFVGDKHAPGIADTNGNQSFDWSHVTWQSDGSLPGGVVETDFSDVIYGNANADEIRGLGGNDALDGGAGKDVILGGEGDDLIGGGAGSDRITGGAGNDTILSATGLTVKQRVGPSDTFTLPAGAVVRSSGPTWAVYNIGSNLFIDGGATIPTDQDGDIVDGGAGNDLIFTGLGADAIQGGDGNDYVEGHGGDDMIDGDAGDDVLFGDGFTSPAFGYRAVSADKHGADLIDGGEGDDKIVGGGGSDALYGGMGDDVILGDTNGDAVNEPGWLPEEFQGDDYIDGEDGNDLLAGDGGDDTLYGGSGDDELQGDRAESQVAGQFHGNDYLDGEEGSDVLIGGGKDDQLYGGEGNDRLVGDGDVAGGFHGNDYLDGEAGDDTLIGGGKDDVLYGGDGDDTLVGDDEPGTPGAQVAGNDYLDGGDGGDKLWGGDGNDTLIGGAGADYLDGGEGDDVYVADLGDTIHDSGGHDSIKIDGGAPIAIEVHGADLVLVYDSSGSTQAVTQGMRLMSANVNGGPNTLTIEGAFQGGGFSLNSTALDDAFFDGYDVTLVTTADNQNLSTWNGNDTLTAENDNATLDGRGGNDVLIGGTGTNTLWGGYGDDVLVSRGLLDTLNGGEGNDTYRLEGAAGEVTIAADTQSGEDTIVFAGSSATTTLAATMVDEDVVITSTRAVTATDGTVTQKAGPTLRLTHFFQAGGAYSSNAFSAITFEDGGQITLAQLLSTNTLGGATEDTLYGSLFVDHIDGGGGDDEIRAGGGDDTLIGGSGNDGLYGDSGRDILEGGDGNDVLRGGYGSDILRGGAGDDTYVFGTEVVPSLVSDQEVGQQVDVIEDSEGANIISLGDGMNLDGVSFSRASDSLSALYFNGQKIEIHGATSGFMVRVNGLTRTLESFTRVVEPPPVDPRLTPAQQAFLASRERAVTAEISREVLAGLFAKYTDATSSLWKQVNSNEPSISRLALPFNGYVTSEHYGVVGYSDSAGHALATNMVSGEYGAALSSVTSFRPLELALAAQGKDIEVTSMSPSVIGFGLGPNQTEGMYGWRVLSWYWTGKDKSIVERYGTYTYSEYVSHQDAHAANVVLGDAANTLTVGASVVHAGAGDDVVSVEGNWLNSEQDPRRIALLLGATASFVDGGDGDDTIRGSDLDDVLLGGRGRDYLQGGNGGDRYLILDYGQSSDDEDVINDTGATMQGEGGQVYASGAYDVDAVEFGPGIALADLYFLRETVEQYGQPTERLVVVRDGRRLVSIDVPDPQSPQGAGVEYFHFEDGGILTFKEALVRAHVAAPLTVGSATDANLLEDGVFNYSVGRLFGGGTGTVTYSAKLADGSALPGWLAFDRATGAFTGTLVNEPAASFTVKVTATDRAGATGSVNFSIGIESVNDAPLPGVDVLDQAAFQDQPFAVKLGDDLFTDADPGDTLSWRVQLSDGRPLPAWLSFDAASRTLSGTPTNADSGVLTLQIVVTDGANTSGSQVFHLSVTETDGIDVLGTAAADNLTGSAGDDHIDGLGRADVMDGGDGDDVYVVDNTGDVVVEGWNHGYDRIESQVSYTLPGNVEAITLKGTRNLAATGNLLNNELTGNSGSNLLDGRGGNDKMSGGAGNDVYEVDSEGDQVVERAGEGTDTVETKVSYALSSNVERLTLRLPGLVGTGNDLANVITGSGGGSTLYGFGGNDTLRGGLGGDTLVGGDGNDRLEGGDGRDHMEGGAGNDVYLVNDQVDEVVESDGEGTDTVQASVSFTLTPNVENLTLIGTGNFEGTGNELANTIVGNGSDNWLIGLGGNDRLRGGAGDDGLFGGDGNDRLDGGTGADYLAGGTGNDAYILDDVGDVVEEFADEGTDTVQTSLSFVLGANLENLTLTGVGLLSGTGNELNNVLTANAAGSVLNGQAGNDTLKGGAAHDVLYGGDGNDRLDGGALGDTLIGGAGNDVYVVDSLADQVVESADEGTDTVQTTFTYTLGANVENLTLTGLASAHGNGNELANVITANAAGSQLVGLGGNDTLRGGAAADVLIGGTGNDRLEGGLGGDTYEFGRGDGQDTIVENDATPGVVDTLHFDAGIDANQLWWRKSGNNLEVSVIGSTDKVTLSNWYLGDARHVEVFELANGKHLLDTQVQALVQAMASFSPPAAGQTSLPANYQSSLEPVIAANWQ